MTEPEQFAVYPFVPSHVDLGVAKGPRLAIVHHMAEGGGTVGYLSRPNPNNVSVHFVVEYSGRVVQMLKLDHMHSSIRTSAIRTTNDSTPPYYGKQAAVAVMGKWADIKDSLGPNHASIGVEVEGFAKDGPNAKQSVAIDRLAADMGARFPSIKGQLGHRDWNSYKGCPGKKFPWGLIGGHGLPLQEDDPVALPVTKQGDMHVTLQPNCPFYDLSGKSDGGSHNVPGTLLSPYQASNGTNHFRAIYAGPDPVKVVLVKPATITAIPPAGGDVTHKVTVAVDGGTVYEGTV